MSIHVLPDEPEQVTFNGMPVEEIVFSLKSVNRLVTDRVIAPNTFVIGTFSGRVKGNHFDDELKRVKVGRQMMDDEHNRRLKIVVEVLEATVTEG